MQFENAIVHAVDRYLNTLPAHGKLQAGYLRGLKSLVGRGGVDPKKVLEYHGIDPLTFESSDCQVNCSAVVDLLEYCSRLLHEPLFGFRLAELQEPDVYGCAIALARAAPTLRHGIQSLIDYVPVSASPECELEMVTARDVVELRWRTNKELGHTEQVHYQGLLLIMKTLRMLGREHFQPRYASLAFKVRRSDILILEDHLRCKVYSKSDAHAIAFPVDLLDRPIASSNRMLFDILGSYMAQLRAASRSGFAEQVEAYIRSALSSGNCTVDGCAEKLGTASRTLQKRLARMNVKFSDIVQNERMKLAKHALCWSDFTLDEIAFQLGYSEQTSFGRAFKRYTGMTPQAFRVRENRKRPASSNRLEAV